MALTKEDERRVKAYELALMGNPTAGTEYLCAAAERILRFIHKGV